MNSIIKLQDRAIGPGCPIFIIAEISANHGQDLNRAIRMIRKAKECGADAVKFQTYTPDTLTIDEDNRLFRVRHPKWGGQTLYSLYRKAYTPWNWFKKLKKAADDAELVFFSTAFDKSAVDFLEEIRVPFHKIASFELVDLPLIEYMSKKKKPVILSTGMATLPEIKEAVGTARSAGAKGIILLKCVSSYPAKPENMNLATIPDMARRFGCNIGLSDHTLGTGIAVAAVSVGAVLVEKHFTLSRKLRTPDSFFSLEPAEFKAMTENIREVEKAFGAVHYGMTKDERMSRCYRKSLFAVADINKGECFTEENVRSIRPGYGLPPKYYKRILGKRAAIHIKRGTPLRKNMLLKSPHC